MTSYKPNLTSKETEAPSDKEKNYQLNMELLSSIKSMPGKIVNLQTENFINEEINKKLNYPEGKYTTSSSISKDFFYEQKMINSDEKINKKLYTTNSVFKPMLYVPFQKSTLNYYPMASMMSFSELFFQNQPQNLYKGTNLSFSQNSFSPNIPNNRTNNFLLNPMNTLTQINQINFCNPINSFNILNPSFNPNLNFSNNINNENNIFLNQKRNIEEKKEIKLKKNILFNTINDKNKIKEENKEEKKNLFTVVQKSVYVYKKRKPRKKKILTGIRNKLKCNHEGCEGIFKTKKQLNYHHYKMNSDCHNDTITLLKMINRVKKILLKKEKSEEYKKKFEKIYKETMKNVSLDEHIETLIGFNFEDTIV